MGQTKMRDRRQKKVLVVEDNEDFARILSKRLKTNGYEVSHFSNGFEVLSCLTNGNEPSAVILDLMIPGRSGFDLLNSIKMKWTNTKLFIFSAHDNYKHIIPPGLAEGFFLKTDGVNVLLQALETSLA